MARIKALTISQPFASLIAAGDKWVENRRWGTDYRGPLAIHAGKGTQYLDRGELAHYPTGCVIAIAKLFGCVPLSALQRRKRSERLRFRDPDLTVGAVLDHEHTEGPWCWILVDAQQISPIKINGAQGLWELDVADALVTYDEGDLTDV